MLHIFVRCFIFSLLPMLIFQCVWTIWRRPLFKFCVWWWWLLWCGFWFGHPHPHGWPNQRNPSNERQQGPQRCKKSSGEGLWLGGKYEGRKWTTPTGGFPLWHILCTFVPLWLAAVPNCDELLEFLTHVVVRMPVGFLRSPGSMDLRLGGVHTKFRVKNLHSFSEVPTGQPWLW